jgi:hypothetical protein
MPALDCTGTDRFNSFVYAPALSAFFCPRAVRGKIFIGRSKNSAHAQSTNRTVGFQKQKIETQFIGGWANS